MKYDYVKALDNERKNTLSKLENIDSELAKLEQDRKAGDISINLYNQTKTQLIEDSKDIIAISKIRLGRIDDDFRQFVDEWNVIKGIAVTDDAKLIQNNMKLSKHQIREKMIQYKYNPTMAQMFYEYSKTLTFADDMEKTPDYELSADDIKRRFSSLCDLVKYGIMGSKLSYNRTAITDNHFTRILAEKFTNDIDIREMDKYIKL